MSNQLQSVGVTQPRPDIQCYVAHVCPHTNVNSHIIIFIESGTAVYAVGVGMVLGACKIVEVINNDEHNSRGRLILMVKIKRV